MTEMGPSGPSMRQTAPAWQLLLRAIGGPRQAWGKLTRLGRTLRLYLNPSEIERRLQELEKKGFIDERPHRWQILFGGLDMLRFVIEPASRDYYALRGISFGFHQLLRVLDDPTSMMDPTGFLSDRDTIMGHLMQVVHLNPVYDLQLIQMFPDGLENLEEQVQAMVDGTHPRRATIGAIVEDPTYHARLLDYIQRFRKDPANRSKWRSVRTEKAGVTLYDAFLIEPRFLPCTGRVLMERFCSPPGATILGWALESTAGYV